MIQKRCLNCYFYCADELDLEGTPLPRIEGAVSLGFAGYCDLLKKRMKDTWACGGWTIKSDKLRKDQK